MSLAPPGPISDSDISGTNCIIFGHDNGGLTPNTSDVPGTINRRLNRVWRLEKYGTLTGSIAFDCTNLGIGDGNDLRLLVDSDGTFADATIAEGSYSAPNFTVSNHTFENSYYYTIASTTSDNSLPVELSSFTATDSAGVVIVRWVTESEVDNLGFHIHRSLEENGPSERITSELIGGAGNTTTEQTYSFTDRNVVKGGTYWYKLENISFDGSSEMDGPISTRLIFLPDRFALLQNHPNPFNPVTTIGYDLPKVSDVTLTIYTVTGQKIATLVSDHRKPGYYEVTCGTGADSGTGCICIGWKRGNL